MVRAALTREPDVGSPGQRLVAVSGLGSIGTQHVHALGGSEDVAIVAFDPDQALREAARSAPGVRDTVADFEQLLAYEPDALVIAGPDHVHLAQLRSAVTAGIPTMVEKPLAASWMEAADARRWLMATAVPVLVGYVLRHRTVVREARLRLQQGAVGTPTSFQVLLGAYGTITAAASRFATPEHGRLYRDYSHEWDYLRWCFGPITRCLAVARTVEEVAHVEQPNVVDGLLECATGVVGSFHIDYVDPVGVRRLQVIGTNGSMIADIGRGIITVRGPGSAADEEQSFSEAPSVVLARQAAHLLAVADGEQLPVVGIEDGLAALATSDALRRSAETRTWVDVPG